MLLDVVQRCVLAGALLAVACGEAEAPATEASEPTVVAPPEPGEPSSGADDEPAEPAEAPVVGPTTHELLFLVLHDEPLLPSEERLFDVLEDRMRRRRDVERREVTPDEAAFAQLFFDPASTDEERAAASFPATFGEARKVVIVRVIAPRLRSDGDRVTRGIAGVLLFRPPAIEPSVRMIMDDSASWRLTDDGWAGWLAELLRDAEGT